MSCSEIDDIAKRLAALHEQRFGGKNRGRYRISAKVLRQLAGRRRLYPDMIEALRRRLYDMGLVLIDMDNFFVVLSARTFATYRRFGPSMVEANEATGREGTAATVQQ